MVALAHVVSQIAAVIVGVHIAHEAFLASALRTGGFLLAVTRDARALQEVSAIGVHSFYFFQ